MSRIEWAFIAIFIGLIAMIVTFVVLDIELLP